MATAAPPAKRPSSLRMQNSLRGGTMSSHAALPHASTSTVGGRSATPTGDGGFTGGPRRPSAPRPRPSMVAGRGASRSRPPARVDSGVEEGGVDDEEEEDEAEENAALVRWWKARAGWLRNVSVTAFLHEATILGDYVFEQYAHFWQLLRDTHFSQFLPAIVVTRIFFRGVYFMIVPLKRHDVYAVEWRMRREMKESFRIHRGVAAESLFYEFYIDVLVELVFVALICKANNAAISRTWRKRGIRNWQWLALGVGSLFVCVARDVKLTHWYLLNGLQAKTKNIIHTIGTCIIMLCDALMIASIAYVLSVYVAASSRDVAISARRVKAAREAAEDGGDGGKGADVEREEAILEDLLDDTPFRCLAKSERAPGSRAEDVLDRAAAAAGSATPRYARFLACLGRVRGVLMSRAYAPSYVFREADDRALLAALLHPPGACPGVFGAHDLVDAVAPPPLLGTPPPLAPRAKSQVFTAMRSAIRADAAGPSPSGRRDAATARHLTNGIFSGLWFVKPEGADLLTPAQKRAARLERLHLTEGVELAWEDRVRDRSYRNCARLIMAVIMGWLLAVAATAGLAYLSFVLQNYVERRLEWIESTMDDVDALLATYVARGRTRGTSTRAFRDHMFSRKASLLGENLWGDDHSSKDEPE